MARNTPTHVGKTRDVADWVKGMKKHPHARGEDAIATDNQKPPLETPPRTWGRHIIAKLEKKDDGNTPTHVGKTVG